MRRRLLAIVAVGVLFGALAACGEDRKGTHIIVNGDKVTCTEELQ